MRIGVVGKGCIGKCLSNGLSHSNSYSPSLLLKSSTINSLKENSIINSNLTCNITYYPMENHKSIYKSSDIPIIPIDKQSSNLYDVIIVPIKSFQILDAIKQLECNNFLSNNPILILFHNGIIPISDITSCFRSTCDNIPIIFGTTANSATVYHNDDDPFIVRQTGYGFTSLGFRGYISNQMKENIDSQLLCDIFNTAFNPTSWFADIEPILLLKLAVNCCINPLTAIYQIRNDGLMENSKFKSEMKTICKELCNMFNAYYNDLNMINNCQLDGDIWKILCDFESLWNRIYSTLEGVKLNYSSMNRDIYFCRKSEIDEINGYAIKLANKYNIDVSFNQEIVDKIHNIQNKYSS